MLNPLRILRNSSKITLVTVVSVLLNFPLSIFIARMVLPDELGQINFVTLWLTCADQPGRSVGFRQQNMADD